MSVVDPRYRVLDGRARLHHLANTVKRLSPAVMSGSVTGGGDAACSQITLGNLMSCAVHEPTLAQPTELA